MDLFEEIILKYGWSNRVEKANTLIEQVESFANFLLPNDYKKYLTGYLGFENHVGKEYLVLWDLDEIIEANLGYSITVELQNTLGIGSNGAGEFIAIELQENNEYRVVLSPYIDLDSTYHIEIGTSFTDFLYRLDNGLEWFTKH